MVESIFKDSNYTKLHWIHLYALEIPEIWMVESIFKYSNYTKLQWIHPLAREI